MSCQQVKTISSHTGLQSTGELHRRKKSPNKIHNTNGVTNILKLNKVIFKRKSIYVIIIIYHHHFQTEATKSKTLIRLDMKKGIRKRFIFVKMSKHMTYQGGVSITHAEWQYIFNGTQISSSFKRDCKVRMPPATALHTSIVLSCILPWTEGELHHNGHFGVGTSTHRSISTLDLSSTVREQKEIKVQIPWCLKDPGLRWT